MAQAPSLPARTVTARTGATRLWWGWLVVGVALTVAYALTPEHYLGLRDFALYPSTDLGAALAIVIGVYLFRPVLPAAWLLIAAWALFTLGGDLTWGVYEVNGEAPTTSLADVLYLAGYPCLLAGLLLAVRWRSPYRDRRELIDSAIVGTSAFLLVWVYVVSPFVFGGLDWTEAFVSSAYPVGDMIVLAAAVRLMLGGQWNVTSLRLLLVGLVLTLGGDLAYAADNTTNIRVVDTLLQLGIVAIGLAGLHRSMPALTSSRVWDETKRGSGFVRLVLLAGICAVPLIVLAVQSVTGNGLHLVAVLVTTVLLAVFVVARSLGLTTTAEDAAEREATLSRYAAELLRTVGEDRLYAVAGRTASDLVGRGEARIVDPGGVDQAHRHAFTTPVKVGGEIVAELVADGEDAALRRASGSLSTVAAQLSLALERDRLIADERATRSRQERLQIVTDIALAHPELDDLASVLLPEIREMLAADTCALFLLDEDSQELVVRAVSHPDPETEDQVIGRVRYPVGKGVVGRVAAEGKPMVIADVEHTTGLNPIVHEIGIRSLCYVPLLIPGAVVGVLHVGSLLPREFTDDDVELLRLAADRAAVAIVNGRLFEAERETAAALARSNEELRELDKMKDLFVGGVSHELRTPLTSMLGYLEILRGAEASGLTDEQQHFLEIVDRNCHRLTDLIDDILFMSRLDSGRFQLERESVDLGELVADRVESIRPAARKKRVGVHFRVSDAPSKLWADPSRLVQVVDNLLSNAVKFTPEEGDVFVTVGTSSDTMQLEVRDTGVGIPEDEARRLFERFFRATTAQNIQGTGLGLSIAKAIVEAHGGTIAVHSVVAIGTTVTVDLPLQAEPAAPTISAQEVTT
jgi:signal transduction histidine kinase